MFAKKRQTNSVESAHAVETHFHSAIWGTLTVKQWKNIEATYQQGIRCIHAETKYAQLKHRIITNLGVRADLRIPTIHQTISSRRLGLLKRVLDSNSECVLGLMVDQ